jgi:hypothetical protein
LALFGRRLPERVARSSLPASENLHITCTLPAHYLHITCTFADIPWASGLIAKWVTAP